MTSPLNPLELVRRSGQLALLLLALSSWGCNDTPALPPVWAEIGSPLPALTPGELARFEDGRAVFRRSFTPVDGLGPRFNENACNACHTFPADGGTGETHVLRATHTQEDGRCDLLADQGGENLRLQVTRQALDLGAEPVRSIADATHTSRFTIPFVFGLGLIDAIPVETLAALADPDDSDGDGISGRLGTDGSGQPARFGRKADVASLRAFTDLAFRLEMGLTTPAVPDEARAGGSPPLPDGSDPAPDPELDEATIDLVVDFMRFLAPPAPADPEAVGDIQDGYALFRELGCAGCHVELLRAGPDASAAIADQSIALFSDLLLHDMGPGLAGTCAQGATPSEYRTEPLMGLRYREIYLHDGRASRVRDAILMHGGEAQNARDAFAALDRVTQEALLQYLDTL